MGKDFFSFKQGVNWPCMTLCLRILNIIVDVIRKRYTGVSENSRESISKWGRNTSSKDNFGTISRCAVYQSIYHCAKWCPDKCQEEDNINVTLFLKEIYNCYITKFDEELTIFFFYGNENLHNKHKNIIHLAPRLLCMSGIQKEVITKRKN